jgi:hypothetical protein
LLPYLHTKRGQAEEMLEYCCRHRGTARVRRADSTRIREMYATGSYTQQQLATMFDLCYATLNHILAQDRPPGARRHLRRRPAPAPSGLAQYTCRMREKPANSSEPAE